MIISLHVHVRKGGKKGCNTWQPEWVRIMSLGQSLRLTRCEGLREIVKEKRESIYKERPKLRHDG